MLLHAFGILCGLSVVVFAALSVRPLAAVAFVASFVAASLTLSTGRFLDPSWVAAAVALAAGAALWKPRWSIAGAVVGGMTAVVWAILLEAQGLPALGAYGCVTAFAAGSAVLAARRASFAPARLQEEALTIVAAFAVVVAAAPTVSSGFDSAIALTAVRITGESSPSAPWALIAAAVCAVAGGLYASLKNR